MKIGGKELRSRHVETLVLPRGDKIEDAIVLKAQAIPSYDEFNALCPAPSVPVKIMRGGQRVADSDRPAYKQAREEYEKRRLAWMVLKSLEATEGLEWETVDMGDPETWTKVEDELRDSGFSAVEVTRIISLCFSANALDDAKLEKAREDFLRLTETEDTGTS